MQDPINFKLIVLGSQGVGKSSLIMRYIKGEFLDLYNVTVGVEFATKIVTIESGQQVRLQIWDTAGQQFFRALVRSFYKGISVVFFLFAIDNAMSFRDLRNWVVELKENSSQEVVIVLIGSRADNQAGREVSPDEAAIFLKEIQGAFFVETSAKTGLNIQILFRKTAQILYRKFVSNADFKNLVQPVDYDMKEMRQTKNMRGTSIILKKQTLPKEGQNRTKKKCCE